MKKQIAKMAMAMMTMLSIAMLRGTMSVSAAGTDTVWLASDVPVITDSAVELSVQSDGKTSDGVLEITYDKKMFFIDEDSIKPEAEKVAMYSVNVDAEGGLIKISYLSEGEIAAGDIFTLKFTVEEEADAQEIREALDKMSLTGEVYDEAGNKTQVSAKEPEVTAAPTKEPAAPTKEPIEPTREPAAPTKEPIEPTKEPAAPTKEPAAPTEKPGNQGGNQGNQGVQRPELPSTPIPTKEPGIPIIEPVKPVKGTSSKKEPVESVVETEAPQETPAATGEPAATEAPAATEEPQMSESVQESMQETETAEPSGQDSEQTASPASKSSIALPLTLAILVIIILGIVVYVFKLKKKGEK